MAWTAIKTWLPEELITSSDLNTYLRDNMNETVLGRPAATNGGFAVVSGPNEVTMRAAVSGTKSTTSTTSSTTGVNVGPSINNVTHGGQLLVLIRATIRIQSSGALANYGIGTSTGLLVSTSHAVINSDTRSATLSSHVILSRRPSPESYAGFLWSSSGAHTAEVTDAVITIQPL